MKRVIPLRVAIVALTSHSIAAAFFGENEPVFLLRVIGGWTATCTLLLMLALTCVATADIVLSEGRYRWWSAVRKKRAPIWLALGAGHAVHSVVAFSYFQPWVGSRFLIYVACCVAVAWLDIHYRTGDSNESLRSSGLMPLDGPLERSWRA